MPSTPCSEDWRNAVNARGTNSDLLRRRRCTCAVSWSSKASVSVSEITAMTSTHSGPFHLNACQAVLRLVQVIAIRNRPAAFAFSLRADLGNRKLWRPLSYPSNAQDQRREHFQAITILSFTPVRRILTLDGTGYCNSWYYFYRAFS